MSKSLQESLNNNGPCFSSQTKSEVSKCSQKRSCIPLRYQNVGYLELHHNQRNLSKSKDPSKAFQNTPLNENIPSPSTSFQINPSYHYQARVCRKTAITTICSPATPTSSGSKVSVATSGRSNDLLKRSSRSIFSLSNSDIGDFESNHSTNRNLGEGLHLQSQQVWAPVNGASTTLSNDFLKLGIETGASEKCIALLTFSRKVGEVASRARGYFLCPICNEPLNNSSIIACGHIFCMRCACSWFETQDNCPCCRYHIAGKDINDDIVLAKEFSEISPALASVLNAGNFYANLTDEHEHLSDDWELEKPASKTLISCSTSANILSKLIAPVYKHIFDEVLRENRESSSRRKGQGNPNENYRINFLAALWFLRQSSLLQMPETTSPETKAQHSISEESISIIERLPVILRLEIDKGTESSRESLLRKVMSMKITSLNHSANFTIPSNSLASMSKKALSEQTQQIQFRLPSLHNLMKMILVGFIFLVIVFAVYLFDVHDKPIRINRYNMYFSKLDVIVCTLSIFMMISYTETDRISALRRRTHQNRQRRRNRRRNRIRIDDLFFT